MALTVEDGTGKSDADSYQSTADIETYETSYKAATTYASATTAVKERAAREATQYLDGQYGHRFLGSRYSGTQALEWPRSGVVTRDGHSVDSDVIPVVLKQAHAELAIAVAGGDSLNAAVAAADRNIKSESVRTGPIVEGIEYFAGGKTSAKKYPKVEALLRTIIEAGGTMSRA